MNAPTSLRCMCDRGCIDDLDGAKQNIEPVRVRHDHFDRLHGVLACQRRVAALRQCCQPRRSMIHMSHAAENPSFS